jgi:hypothetical protein
MVFGTDDAVAVRKGYIVFAKLTDEQLALLGQETYDKRHWSAEDVRTLRECWREYQRRGEDTTTLFRPAYSEVLKFHEIDSGEVGEDDVRLLERAGAGIAPDYREVMRKLRAVERIHGQSQDYAATEPHFQKSGATTPGLSAAHRQRLTLNDFRTPCSREEIRGLR